MSTYSPENVYLYSRKCLLIVLKSLTRSMTASPNLEKKNASKYVL